MTNEASKQPPPPDWPDEADKEYERIRVLGRGAFGEVILGRHRGPVGEYVAIKGVSIQTENEGATAEREISILSQLSHPNIIRLLKGYPPASESAKGRYMVCQYVNGPDIGALLEERGALGLALCRRIAQDLVSAVAYLHVRGVMHRDIKPDNIMLEGCLEGKEKWVDDDVMWRDGKKCSEALKKRGFKAILADFGFARATKASDYSDENSNGISNSENERIAALKNMFQMHEVQSEPILPTTQSKIQRHKSRMVLRGKSALGTRHFAAPEIEGNVRRKERESALTSCVSDYALISDAYAIGATMSEICTGVPPGEDIDSYVTTNRKKPKRKNPLHIVVKPLYKTVDTLTHNRLRGSQKGPHEIQLRRMIELPTAVSDFIESLMKPDINERLSVREAQNHMWIGGYDALSHGDVPSKPDDPMVFLESQ